MEDQNQFGPDNRYQRYYEEKKPNPIINFLLKGFGFKVAIFLLSIIVLLFLTSNLIEKQVGDQIIKAIDESIDSKITTKNFNLSFFKSFPYAEGALEDVTLEGKNQTAFVEAKELGFKFSILSLFSESYNVKSIVIRDGAVSIIKDKKGNFNYDIFKSETESSTTVNLNFEKATFENVALIYQDIPSDQYINCTIQKGNLKGDIGTENIDVVASGKIISEFFEFGNIRYLTGTKIDFNSNFLVDIYASKYTIQQLDATLNGNPLNVRGTIISREKDTQYDLTFQSKNGNIRSVIELIPPNYLPEQIKNLKSSGDFELAAKISGKQSQSEAPKVAVIFSLQNGTLSSKKIKDAIRGFSFKAIYKNGNRKNAHTSTFKVKNFMGSYGNQKVNGALLVKNFENPHLDFRLNGSLDVNQLYSFLEIPQLKDAKGTINASNIKLSGLLSDMTQAQFVNRVKSSGTFTVKDINLELKTGDIDIPNGKVLVNNNTISVTDLNLIAKDNDLIFTGKFNNLLPVIMADSVNSYHASLGFNSKMYAKTLNIDALEKLLNYEGEENDKGEENSVSIKGENISKREVFFSKLNGNFLAQIDHFKYGRLRADDFEGSIEIKDNHLYIDGDTETMDGNINLEGTLYFTKSPHLVANLTCNEINATEFFYQFNNFGQETLTDNHIRGQLNAQLNINAFWGPEGSFLKDKLKVFGYLNAQNGELVDFDLLNQFSSMVHKKSLEHVVFNKMENWLEISNQRVYIPTMFIQNNATNLTLCGTHSFEQDIDYSIKVNAGQALVDKLFNKDVKKIKAKKEGLFNVFTNVQGNLEGQYDIDLSARKYAKKSFDEGYYRKERIKAIILSEFGSLMENKIGIAQYFESAKPDTKVNVDFEEPLEKEEDRSTVNTAPDKIMDEDVIQANQPFEEEEEVLFEEDEIIEFEEEEIETPKKDTKPSSILDIFKPKKDN